MEKLKAKKLEKKGIVFKTKEEKRKEKRLKEKEKRQKKKRRLYKQQEKEQEFDDFSDKVSFFFWSSGTSIYELQIFGMILSLFPLLS